MECVWFSEYWGNSKADLHVVEVTPFWKKSLTWGEKNSSLNFEHQAGLDERSLNNRVSKLWTLPLSIQSLLLDPFRIPTEYSFFDIYRLVVFLFFMWLSVSAIQPKPLCSAQLLHNPRVVHIQNAGPRWLFAIHILRILIEEILTQKRPSSKTSLIYFIHSKFPTKGVNPKNSNSTVFHVRFDCATMTCRFWNGRLNAQVVLSILFFETRHPKQEVVWIVQVSIWNSNKGKRDGALVFFEVRGYQYANTSYRTQIIPILNGAVDY